MTKGPTLTEKKHKIRATTLKATITFDYTTIVERLRAAICQMFVIIESGSLWDHILSASLDRGPDYNG